MKIKLSHTVLSIFFLLKKINKNKLFLWKCICYVKILNSVDNLYCTNHVIIPLWLFLLPIQQCCIKQWPRCSSEEALQRTSGFTRQWSKKLWNQLRNVHCHIIITLILQAQTSREKRELWFSIAKTTQHMCVLSWSYDMINWQKSDFYRKLYVSRHPWLSFPFSVTVGFFLFLTLRY